jgi:HEAT repeat protein/outer membrane protein assembly factor BamB
MFRCKLAFSMLMIGLFVGLGSTQPQKGKEKEKDKEPAFVEPDTYLDDLKVVKQNGLKGDGPDILEYFRKKTLTQPDPKEIAALVRQLGDEDFPVREKAFKGLANLGAAAFTGLKDWETANPLPKNPMDNDPSLETRKRVAELKLRIDTKAEPTLQAAAARVLAKLKTEGTADGLMAFLPFASDPTVVDEICKTLGAVAVRNGKVEPILLKSLQDPIAVKRGAAGEALARAGVKEQYPNVKKLFADKDLSVRLRVCMAMMTSQDPALVPVMIDLLAELTPNQLWPIEEALIRLAGEKAPNVGLGNDAASRKACRDAWSKWYDANAKTIDLAKLSEASVYLGYTLVVQHNNRIGAGGGNNAEILELDKDKNVRWKFTIPGGQNAAVDAQVIPGNRVLVAEFQFAKVTERDLKGEVKWEYNCGGNPFTVQRLPNGNTFIGMQGRLIEIDRNKNEVWSYQRPNFDIFRARKLPNGEVAFATNTQFFRMDPKTQKINSSFNITPLQLVFGAMDVLPNGNVLLGHWQQNRVNEYDKTGAQVNNVQFAWANSVVRLPNGNNLVSSYNQRRVAEFKGNQSVWEYQAEGIVFVSRRR